MLSAARSPLWYLLGRYFVVGTTSCSPAALLPRVVPDPSCDVSVSSSGLYCCVKGRSSSGSPVCCEACGWLSCGVVVPPSGCDRAASGSGRTNGRILLARSVPDFFSGSSATTSWEYSLDVFSFRVSVAGGGAIDGHFINGLLGVSACTSGCVVSIVWLTGVHCGVDSFEVVEDDVRFFIDFFVPFDVPGLYPNNLPLLSLILLVTSTSFRPSFATVFGALCFFPVAFLLAVTLFFLFVSSSLVLSVDSDDDSLLEYVRTLFPPNKYIK